MRMRTPFHRMARIGGLARSVGMWSIWVLVGVFLWWLPGRFPPPAWMALWTWLHAQEPVPPIRLLVGCGQAAALALSWLGWVGLALWLVRRRSFMHTIVSWPQDGMSTVRPSEGPRSQQEAIPSSLVLQERQELRDYFSDHAVQKGDASRQPPHKQGSVRLATLLTASSNGMEAAWPLHARAPVSSCAYEDGGAEESYELVMSGWCQAGIAASDWEPEDSLLVATGEALLHEAPRRTVALNLLAVADGRQCTHEHGQDSSSRQALAVLGETLLSAFSTEASPDEAFIIAALLASVEQARTRLAPQRSASPFDLEEGTALAAALVWHRTAYLASLGNSRAYLYSESSGFCQITTDDAALPTFPCGERNGSERVSFTRSHDLYRSLEAETPARADHFTVPLREGDLLLLCTDGCWREVAPDLLAELVAGCARRLPADPLRLSAVLHEQVLERGGHDAASLLVLAVLTARGAEAYPAVEGGKRRSRTTHAPHRRSRAGRAMKREGETA